MLIDELSALSAFALVVCSVEIALVLLPTVDDRLVIDEDKAESAFALVVTSELN